MSTELRNKGCTWFGEICSCALNNSNNKFHKTTYRPYFRALYVSVDYWTMIEAPLTDMLFLSMKRHEIRKYILNYVLGFWATWRWKWKEDHTTFVLKNSQVTIVRGVVTKPSVVDTRERIFRSHTGTRPRNFIRLTSPPIKVRLGYHIVSPRISLVT